MRSTVRRGRLLLMALATAFMVTFVTTNQAFATQPGEQNAWFSEQEGGRDIRDADGVSEAINAAGNQLTVWRDITTNHIMARFNHGPEYQIPNAVTEYPPVVIATSQRFQVFHVGTDHGIYSSRPLWWGVNGEAGAAPEDWASWVRMPGHATSMAISVAARDAYYSEYYVAYRADGDNRTVLGFAGSGDFQSTNLEILSNGRSNTPPAVSYDWRQGRLWAAIAGENDRAINVSWRPAPWSRPDAQWQPFRNLAGVTYYQPSIAVDANGRVEIAHVGTDQHIYYSHTFTGNANLWSGWVADNTNWQTWHAVSLIVRGVAYYTLMLGANGLIYNKVNWNQQP